MNRFLRFAALPLIVSLTCAATSAQALPISLERFRAAIEESRAAGSSARARPAATKPAAQATKMVCTTQQTTSRVGLLRKKTTKSKTVCTPVKSAPAVAPDSQTLPVQSFASTPRPHNPAPAPNGNAGGNSTNVGSSSYVSPVISAPLLFATDSSETGPDLPVVMASIEPPAEVPEPATLALLGAGLAGLLLARRRAPR
jgi:hypothetical protein